MTWLGKRRSIAIGAPAFACNGNGVGAWQVTKAMQPRVGGVRVCDVSLVNVSIAVRCRGRAVKVVP